MLGFTNILMMDGTDETGNIAIGQSQFVYGQVKKLSNRNYSRAGTNMRWTYLYDRTWNLLEQEVW